MILSRIRNRCSQKCDELIDSQFSLLEDASQNRSGQIKTIVTWHGHAQMSLGDMPKLSVTSRLVMDIKASSQKRSEHSSRLEKRKLRAHLGAQRNAQLRGMGPFLVGYFFTGLAKAIEMAADSVARHFEGLFFGAPVRDHSR